MLSNNVPVVIRHHDVMVSMVGVHDYVVVQVCRGVHVVAL